jgi:hypothetical protein
MEHGFAAANTKLHCLFQTFLQETYCKIIWEILHIFLTYKRENIEERQVGEFTIRYDKKNYFVVGAIYDVNQMPFVIRLFIIHKNSVFVLDGSCHRKGA